jgi:hypothetical protein
MLRARDGATITCDCEGANTLDCDGRGIGTVWIADSFALNPAAGSISVSPPKLSSGRVGGGCDAARGNGGGIDGDFDRSCGGGTDGDFERSCGGGTDGDFDRSNGGGCDDVFGRSNVTASCGIDPEPVVRGAGTGPDPERP